MDISDRNIFLGGKDILLSRIVKFFEPQDNVAKEFLLESANLSYEGQLTAVQSEKKIKKIIAVHTAPEGGTLAEFLKVISMDGWGYASLSDWYRYYTKFFLSGGDGVYVPGTIHMDVNFNGWIPFILPLKKDSLFQRVIKKRTIIAKVFMKPAGSLIKFQAERQILVSRIIK